jgi:hypothetical protein
MAFHLTPDGVGGFDGSPSGSGDSSAGGGIVLIILLMFFFGIIGTLVKLHWTENQDQKRYAAISSRLSITGEAHKINVKKYSKDRLHWKDSTGRKHSGYTIEYNLKFSWVVTNNDTKDHELEVCVDEGYGDDQPMRMCTSTNGLTGKPILVKAGKRTRGSYTFDDAIEDPQWPKTTGRPYISGITDFVWTNTH